MKKLFALKNTTTGRILSGQFFGSKPAAKTERDALNRQGDNVFVVTYGPDHDKSKA